MGQCDRPWLCGFISHCLIISWWLVHARLCLLIQPSMCRLSAATKTKPLVFDSEINRTWMEVSECKCSQSIFILSLCTSETPGKYQNVPGNCVQQEFNNWVLGQKYWLVPSLVLPSHFTTVMKTGTVSWTIRLCQNHQAYTLIFCIYVHSMFRKNIMTLH